MALAHEHAGGPDISELRHRLAVSLVVSDLDAGDMARHLGVHRNTINNYLAGRTAPTKARLRLWAEATRWRGCDYDWLATGATTTEAPDPDGPGTPVGTPPGTRTQNLRIGGPVSRPLALVA